MSTHDWAWNEDPNGEDLVCQSCGLVRDWSKSEEDEPSCVADEIRRRIDEVQAGAVELDDFETVKSRLEAASKR